MFHGVVVKKLIFYDFILKYTAVCKKRPNNMLKVIRIHKGSWTSVALVPKTYCQLLV